MSAQQVSIADEEVPLPVEQVTVANVGATPSDTEVTTRASTETFVHIGGAFPRGLSNSQGLLIMSHIEYGRERYICYLFYLLSIYYGSMMC